jgi:hypothetical protein
MASNRNAEALIEGAKARAAENASIAEYRAAAAAAAGAKARAQEKLTAARAAIKNQLLSPSERNAKLARLQEIVAMIREEEGGNMSTVNGSYGGARKSRKNSRNSRRNSRKNRRNNM